MNAKIEKNSDKKTIFLLHLETLGNINGVDNAKGKINENVEHVIYSYFYLGSIFIEGTIWP